jgi:hypothetical protein
LPAVEERGNRFDVKSNADDTENVLLWLFGLPFADWFCISRGSSASSDNSRDDGGPPGEDVDSVEVRTVGEEEAREASSRESR